MFNEVPASVEWCRKKKNITVPLPPHFFRVFRRFWGGSLVQKTHNQGKSRWNKVQTSPKNILLWKRGWHQDPVLPQETALETVKFNKIIKLGRGGKGKWHSVCPFHLAAWNPDLWTPLNHISFSLLEPAAFPPCGEMARGRKKKISPPDKLLRVWAFTFRIR